MPVSYTHLDVYKRQEQPIVATGMEYKAACDSGVCVLAKNDGIVERVTADKITVRTSCLLYTSRCV